MSFSLAPDANADKIALITGGGTGLGRATAEAFVASGAAVAICGRRREPLDSAARALRLAGGRCLTVQADVREHGDVLRLVDVVLAQYGTIDVLVNNAGGQFVAPAEEISLKGWRAVHRLAVDATWDLTQRVATQSMIPRRNGLIVLIGFSPRHGIPGMVHASAARAAVENLAGGLAADWGHYGIRSVCVAPGTILTQGLEQYGPERIAEWTKEVPLGRLGSAGEVGQVIAFLRDRRRRVHLRHDRRRRRRPGRLEPPAVADRCDRRFGRSNSVTVLCRIITHHREHEQVLARTLDPLMIQRSRQAPRDRPRAAFPLSSWSSGQASDESQAVVRLIACSARKARCSVGARA